MENYKKKYEEALGRAKEYVLSIDSSKIVEHIFPELKKSEDEKIKSDIQYAVRCAYGDNSEQTDKILYWLEKPINQKTTESTEPKFKVGDWITDGKYTWKVTVIELLDYILQSQEGVTVDDTISYVDEHFHLWTIKDAKQGDVLTDGDPFIYKGLNDELHPENPVAYCGIDDSGIFKSSTENKWWTEDPVYPATKKQCNRLFSKMKKAGYEWDVEKKELRKIEHKSALSKEDREMFDAIISDIQFTQKAHNHEVNQVVYEREIDWLRSIKDRISQPHWKPSHKQMEMLHVIVYEPSRVGVKFCDMSCREILETLYHDLKNL